MGPDRSIPKPPCSSKRSQMWDPLGQPACRSSGKGASSFAHSAAQDVVISHTLLIPLTHLASCFCFLNCRLTPDSPFSQDQDMPFTRRTLEMILGSFINSIQTCQLAWSQRDSEEVDVLSFRTDVWSKARVSSEDLKQSLCDSGRK